MSQVFFKHTFAVFVTGFCVLLGLSGCNDDRRLPVERLRPVKYIVVHSHVNTFQDRVFTGTAQAAQESRISFNVSGTVKQLPVVVGDTLQPGQLLAALDPATYDVEVQRSRASLAQADAERRNAEAEYQRIRQLYANDSVSRNDLDAALADTESAKANYQAMKQSLELAQLKRSYTRLTASSRCSVASLDVELNENVAVGTQVAVINCGDRWEVEIAVPESLIASFRTGMKGIARFDAIPGETFSASVSEVGITGGSTTTFPVTLTLSDVHQGMRSGLAAEVTFAFSEKLNGDRVFFLPPAAVGQDENGAFVYVLESSEQPGIAITKRRSVQVGELNESGLEIAAGLIDGDPVVTAGVTAVRDGLRVRAEVQP